MYHEHRAYEINNGETPRPLMSVGPCDQIDDQYGPLVIEDPELWDGASIGDVRAHFRDAIFYEARESECINYDVSQEDTFPWSHIAQDPRSSVCLVIDAEALEWMGNSETPAREIHGMREEELRERPNDPMVQLDMRRSRRRNCGRVKGVDADWPPHRDIWRHVGNEPSLLGGRNRIPDPPRPVSQYPGWKPVRCDMLWGLYKDELRDGGRLERKSVD